MAQAASKGEEFREIAHCGGKIMITVATVNGERQYQIGITHSRPTPASWFAIYALQQGIPVETIQMGGIGTPWNTPPVPNCFPVFIASDTTGFFGHLCRGCGNYWRSKSVPSYWMMTCPNCGKDGKPHQFLTEGQVHFVETSCHLYNDSLAQDRDGEYSIDLDKIADAVNSGTERPKFYYVEETQQNRYKCDTCGDLQDILGRFGYCSCCGTRNDLQEFEQNIIPAIRARINSGGPYEACVRDAVSAFDSYACKYVEQLVNFIPITPARKSRVSEVRFHNLDKIAPDINEIFGIDIFRGVSPAEVSFVKRMFHRRHVYEPKGGEADLKYIQDSGDMAVRPKQALHESQQSAHRTATNLMAMAKNLHAGFHGIFPPKSMAIKAKQA